MDDTIRVRPGQPLPYEALAILLRASKKNSPGPANCPRCGRFARIISEHTEYDGNFDQLYVTTACKQCGEITEGVI